MTQQTTIPHDKPDQLEKILAKLIEGEQAYAVYVGGGAYGLRVHIEERGAGTPVVLIHGFGVDHRILLPLDPVLSAHGGWRRLYVDLPWTRGTPLGAVRSAQDVVEAVRDAVVARLGDEPFAVVGSSYGALVARWLAHDLRDQVLGLATLAGVWVTDPDLRTRPVRAVLHESPDVLAGADPDVVAGYVDMAVVQSAAGLDAYRRYVHPGLEAADQDALAVLRTRYALDVEPEDAAPEPFARPTLVLCGRQDHVVGFTDAWRRLDHYPRASFVVLDRAGHNLHLDQPVQTATAVCDWLDRIRASLDQSIR